MCSRADGATVPHRALLGNLGTMEWNRMTQDTKLDRFIP
jgi:hypothetical protein